MNSLSWIFERFLFGKKRQKQETISVPEVSQPVKKTKKTGTTKASATKKPRAKTPRVKYTYIGK